MVSLASGNYCNDLAALLPMGPGDAILTAASGVSPATTGALGGTSIGTALSSNALLALLGAGVVGYGLYEIIDDEDEPSSP